MSKTISIRGATTIACNKKDEIIKETLRLLSEIIERNGLLSNDVAVVNCIISSTADIDEYYPASAITESGMLLNVPLFSTMEPNIKNALSLCIRMLLTVSCDSEFNPKHIYLGKAASLKTNTKD